VSPRAALAAGLLGACLAAPAADARELWRRGAASLDWSGSLREVAQATEGTDAADFQAAVARFPAVCVPAASFAQCPAWDEVGDRDVFTSLTRLRNELSLRLGKAWSAELAYDQELRLGTLDTLGDALAAAGGDDTFLGLEDEIHLFGLEDDADHRRWSHRAYRAFVRYSGPHLEWTLGRQRIPWGVGRLWNPIDRFNAIPPLAIEADESPGIDAIDLRWRFSGFSYAQAVYAPGTRSEDARYAVRFHGVVRDVDVALVAGVFEEARTLGFDGAGNLGDAAVRIEAVWTDPERKVWPVGDPAPHELGSFWQVVVSADTNLDWGSGVYLLVEHFYNGNALGFGDGPAGARLAFFEASETPPPELDPAVAAAIGGPFVRPASSAVFGGSRVATAARHGTGLQLGYDLSTALRGELLTLYDWNGHSAAIVPTLRFSGWNAVELVVGAQVFAGGRRSQYGDQDPLVYAILEYFF
jgi:hypothetical protein